MLARLTIAALALHAAAGFSATKTPEKQGWRPGYDYSIIIPSDGPEGLAPGKVEVRELFLYTSGWSKAMQPELAKWLKTKPAYIEFVREPAVAFPHAREQARLYYTLTAMGREDLHPKFFEFVEDKDRFPVYHTIRHPAKEAIMDMNIKFAKDNGLDVKEFEKIYTSREIDNQVIAAEIDTHGYLVNGTSTVVVNGRYTTSLQRFVNSSPACQDKGPTAENYAMFFKMIEDLAAGELKQKTALK